MPLTPDEEKWAEGRIAAGYRKEDVFNFLAEKHGGLSGAAEAGAQIGSALTGEPDPTAAFNPPAPISSPSPSPAMDLNEMRGPQGSDFAREGLIASLKMLPAYAGGATLPEAASGIPLIGRFPALLSLIGQGLGQGAGETVREKASGEPFQPKRVATEGGMVAALGLPEVGAGRMMASGSGVSPAATDYAYRQPMKAFKPPTTGERVTLVEQLQQNLEDALRHPSEGKQRLNNIISRADERVGLPPNTLGGEETPAGMVDGRQLVTAMRNVAARAGGDSATQAAANTINSEADTMHSRVLSKALEHPQNSPGASSLVKGGQDSGPLWITHREYDDLLRDQLTRPSTKVQQAAAPTVTTQEATADSLRDEARAIATDYGYRQLNREGVTYPTSGGPVTAKEAAQQAQNYLSMIERIKSYFPEGKPSKPAVGGVAKSEEAGKAMLSDDPSELGYRIEQSLKEYQDKTGDPIYDKFKELALRGEFNAKDAQPYLSNMARIFVRPGGASVVERVPIGRRTAGFVIRRSMKPMVRSAIASATGEATKEKVSP